MNDKTKNLLFLLLMPPTSGLLVLDSLSVTGKYDLFDKISSISQTQLVIALILTVLVIGTIYRKARDSENNDTTKLDKSFKRLIISLTLFTLPLLFINYNTYFNYGLDIASAAVLGISIIVGIVSFYKTYKTYDDANQEVSEKEVKNPAPKTSVDKTKLTSTQIPKPQTHDTSSQTPTSRTNQSE